MVFAEITPPAGGSARRSSVNQQQMIYFLLCSDFPSTTTTVPRYAISHPAKRRDPVIRVTRQLACWLGPPREKMIRKEKTVAPSRPGSRLASGWRCPGFCRNAKTHYFQDGMINSAKMSCVVPTYRPYEFLAGSDRLRMVRPAFGTSDERVPDMSSPPIPELRSSRR